MSLRVVPYEATHEAGARAFNTRLRAANSLSFGLPESAPAKNPSTLPPGIEFRHFVVVDDAGKVRGGYFIRMQPFCVSGRTCTVGHYTAPLSEGIIDKRHAPVGAMMLAHALVEQPLLFAMGMGGLDRPLPRMLRAMGWPILETPFYFLVLNASRFLRNIGPLSERAVSRMAAGLLAASGLGSIALSGMQAVRRRSRFDRKYQSAPIAGFREWADRIWEANQARFSLSALRTSEYLRWIYPANDPAYYGERLTRKDVPVGWIEMLDCQPHERSYFGEMRVAALVDGVAPPDAIPSLIHAGVEAARERGADMMISNQMHREWTAALEAAGFWKGPSNYLLALSKELAKLMDPLEESLPRIHFNRGDGDGLVNLRRR